MPLFPDYKNKYLLRQLPSIPTEGCILPPPENRKFCSFECTKCNNECSYNPGTLVTAPVIQVQCNPGYRLSNNLDFSPVACVNGSWKSEFMQCLSKKTFIVLVKQQVRPVFNIHILSACFYQVGWFSWNLRAQHKSSL